MSKTRIYGNENTHLLLTSQAFEAYSNTTPLEIAEHEQEDGSYLYSMRGAIEADDLTAADVNDWLEQTYNWNWCECEEDYCAKQIVIGYTEGLCASDLANYTHEDAEEDYRNFVNDLQMSGEYVPDALTPDFIYEIIHDLYGADWNAIVEIMDDEIREQVHAELAPCTKEEFFARYCELHEQKYGEEFEAN